MPGRCKCEISNVCSIGDRGGAETYIHATAAGKLLLAGVLDARSIVLAALGAAILGGVLLLLLAGLLTGQLASGHFVAVGRGRWLVLLAAGSWRCGRCCCCLLAGLGHLHSLLLARTCHSKLHERGRGLGGERTE